MVSQNRYESRGVRLSPESPSARIEIDGGEAIVLLVRDRLPFKFPTDGAGCYEVDALALSERARLSAVVLVIPEAHVAAFLKGPIEMVNSVIDGLTSASAAARRGKGES